MLNKKYIEPYRDMFNLYNTIKKICSGYVLCFDKRERCFLVINRDRGDEVCLKFFDFGSDIFTRLQSSQTKFSKQIFEKLEADNERVSNEAYKRASENAVSRLEDLVKYSARTNEITQSDINKILR